MRLLSTAFCLLALAACSTTSVREATTSGGTAAAEDVGQYDQTWATPYDQTTCAQWLGEMDSHEKYVAGADMLIGAAHTKNPDAGLPPDSYIENFTQQMSTACSGEATMTIVDAGAALVMIDATLFDY